MRRRTVLTAAASMAAAAATATALVAAPTGFAGTLSPAGTTAAVAAATPCTAGTLVHTRKGPVCGVTADGVTSYMGIPYAAPPVGKLRWRSPRPHKSWHKTLQATTPVKECANAGFSPGSLPSDTTEACLKVKVQVPAGAEPGDNLPVMYELHGGGFLGEARTDDGQNLVRGGNAIYVFVNYRLGILGFLANKAFGPHAGDYGLQDQQAGLRWVKKNIRRFGGDPHNVTIFGESAGGASTCDQVASPTARGLFQKAISISGFYNYQDNNIWSNGDCKSTYFTEKQAQKAGDTFAKKVGCGDTKHVARCLRHTPVDTLLKAGGQLADPTGGGTIGPIVNGTTLTMSPAKAFRTGRVNDVRLISDVGRDEFNGGVYHNDFGSNLVVANTPRQYRTLLRRQFGHLAGTVERLYPLRRYESPFTAYRTVMADSASVCPMLHINKKLARHIPVYVDINMDGDNPAGEGLDQVLGAQHSGSNGLVHFTTSKLDPNQAALQKQLIAQWSHFARTGHPAARHTPSWTRYGTRRHMVMALNVADASGMTPAGVIERQHHCTFWNKVTHY